MTFSEASFFPLNKQCKNFVEKKVDEEIMQ